MLSVSFTRISTKNLDYLGEQTVALSEKNSNQAVINNPLFVQVKTVRLNYNLIVIKKTYSGLGSELQNDDIVRDRYFLSFVRIVNGFATFDGSAKQAPAQLLQNIISETGSSVTNLSYTEESVVINKLIERLAAPEAANAVSAIGAVEEVAKLTEVQKKFDSLYTEQLDANSDLRQQPSASSMRKELENALRSYYAFISSMSAIEPWKDIYSDLNELLKKFK
jgi:hypothetical protein